MKLFPASLLTFFTAACTLNETSMAYQSKASLGLTSVGKFNPAHFMGLAAKIAATDWMIQEATRHLLPCLAKHHLSPYLLLVSLVFIF